MNNSNHLVLLISLFFLVFGAAQSQAQTEKELLAQLVEEDQDAINALVLYPEQTRLAILEATLHPEALIKLESIQSQTSTAFQNLLNDYSKETQQMIWDMTRYPDLIHRLVMTKGTNTTAINDVLKDYPEVIHARAKQALRDYYTPLFSIDELNQSADSAFKTLLQNYRPKTQDALEHLIALPEVLTILTDNIRLSVLVGDLYQKDPQWIIHQADSLNLVVVRQNAQELEDWKQSLEDNPQAMEELQTSTEAFAQEYGYDDDYYEVEVEDDDVYYDREVREIDVVDYYDYHYPYWFSYPSWYYYPRWRPYPYWYDWGFYYASPRTVVIIGLPSFYFTNWYFYNPYHHHRWSHLSSHFVHHYHGHRRNSSSVTTSVTVWQSRNRGVITDSWLKDEKTLPKRFKEYAKFETERATYNKQHPQKEASPKQYLEQNTRKYPDLTKSMQKGVPEKDKIQTTKPKDKIRTTTPKVSPKKKEAQVSPQRQVPSRKKEIKVRPKKKEIIIPPRQQTAPRTTIPKVDKGRDYHKNTWERSKSSRQKVVKPPSQKRTAPKVKTSKSKRKN